MDGLELMKFDFKKKDDIWFKLMNYGEKLGCHQMPERSFLSKDINVRFVQDVVERWLVKLLLLFAF